jgi:hypothetical protein
MKLLTENMSDRAGADSGERIGRQETALDKA